MLGVDVAKHTLACTYIDPVSHEKVWAAEFPNTRSGIERLLSRMPESSALALEPTGRYGQTLALAARDKGHVVFLAQPKRTRSFLNSIQPRVKNDRIDSLGIARYALTCELPRYHFKTPMQEQIDQLLTARRGVSQAIASLEQRIKELPYAAEPLKELVKSMKAQEKGFLKQISDLQKEQDPQDGTPDAFAVERARTATAVKSLQQVPGIGPVVATTVASCLLSRNFPGSDQFVAYCGLDITVRQSGKSKGHGAISKQGVAELRRLLYLAAQANLKTKDSPFKRQYERELAKGLPTTAALCSVARKLARLCWALVTKEMTYDPERVYQQPNQRN